MEDLLFKWGVDISHETVRRWRKRFGRMFAGDTPAAGERDAALPRWRWHLDEIYVTSNGKMIYL